MPEICGFLLHSSGIPGDFQDLILLLLPSLLIQRIRLVDINTT